MIAKDIGELWGSRFIRMSPARQNRIRRLNPNPKEGHLVRGYFNKPVSWRNVKKRLLSGGITPTRPYKGPDGVVRSILHCPIDAQTAQRIGWIKGVSSG